MKNETWNLFRFFDNIIRKDIIYLDSLLFEFEHDVHFNKNTHQIEYDHMLDDDYDTTRPIEIVTIEMFITERLTDEINSLIENIEQIYFSVDNEIGKKAFIRPILSKVKYLIEKCRSYNNPYRELFSEQLLLFQAYLNERYNDDVNCDSESNIESLQGKNQKLFINLTRDQIGALLQLLKESDIIDAKVKSSQLARVIESNVLILDINHNYGPVKQLDVLLSQLKNDDKEFPKILSEIIQKFKTSNAFNS